MHRIYRIGLHVVCVPDAGEEMWSEGRDGMARMSWILPIDMEEQSG